MSSIDLANAVIAGADGPAPVAGEGIDAAFENLARAAILAVADWLQRNPLDSTGLSRRWALATAKRLRREVEQ